MRLSKHSFFSLAAVAGVCGLAAAQLVTPPPATNPAIDEHIPKAPPPPPAPPPTTPPPVTPKRAVKEPIPDLPWKEWERESSGAVLPIGEPLELAALRRNPYVAPEMMSKIEAYLPERLQSMRRIVIDNLDLVEKIDDGIFEKTQFMGADAKTNIGELVKVTKPLQITGMALDLKNKGIIDDKAMGYNSKITTQYTKNIFPPLPADATTEAKNKRTNDALRVVFKSAIDEQIWAYDDLCAFAASEFPSVNAKAPRAEKIKAVKAELLKLPIEKRKETLRKVAGLPAPDAKPAAKPADAKPAEKK